MCLYLLNLSFFVLFQPKTANFRLPLSPEINLAPICPQQNSSAGAATGMVNHGMCDIAADFGKPPSRADF